ncbi:hypothetical protein M3Y98_00470700 [Aphelenchoides besseyi]|nr:hypothetical protein M3Y98_00470700 [Aphelenchoides besseyi]
MSNEIQSAFGCEWSTLGFFFALCLLITCAILWAAHTFYFVVQYLQNYEKTTFVRNSHDRLDLPSILFCNKFPFTQAGLDRLGSAFNTPPVVDYLQNWLDPSYANSPERRQQNTSSSQQAEITISQTLLGQAFKERLDSLLISCIEVVSGCTVQGIQIGAFECCSTHIQSYVSSLNGLCWIFNATNLSQRSYSVYQGLRLDFRISRNHFEPFAHPGIDIYIQPSHYNALRMSTEIENGNKFRLQNRMGTSLSLTKRISSHLDRSSDCGYTIADANEADQSINTNSGWIGCLVKSTILRCKCVPLNVVNWVYRGDFNGQIISELNATSICTVNEYDRCARYYMDFSRPQHWNIKIPSGRKQLTDDVEECKRQFPRPCQQIEYSAQTSNFALQTESQTTTDFISSVAWSFNTLETIDEVRTQSPSLFEMLTFAGYNLALWFTIGMLIWMFFVTSCCRSRVVSNSTPTKVAPALSLVNSSVGSRPNSSEQPLVNTNGRNILPPIQSSRSHDSVSGVPGRLNL